MADREVSIRYTIPLAAIVMLSAGGVTVSQAQDVAVVALPDRQVATVGALGGPASAPAAQEETSAGPSIAGGILLGAAGFAVGGAVAAGIASGCRGHDYCQLEAAFYGAAAGGTFGMALGVHLGNGRRGNLALDFLVGAAIWTAGILVASSTGWDDTLTTIAFITIPIAQLGGTVATERAVGRSRSGGRAAELRLVPELGGGLGLGVSIGL